MPEWFRKEYCDDIDYEQWKNKSDSDFDAECENWVPNINQYKEGEFSDTDRDSTINRDQTDKESLSPEEENKLYLQSQKIREEEEKKEDDEILRQIESWEFKG